MAISARDLEHSPLSGWVTRDGFTVEVKIYRFVGDIADWALEVVDHEGSSTVWTDLFATDDAAYEAFLGIVKTDGMSSFVESEPTVY